VITRAFILPTFNESETIGPLLEKLIPDLRQGEVIVVVDDSSEEERVKLRSVLQNYKAVKLLQGNMKGGRGYAVWRGMRYILEEFPETTHFVEADCDGSHRFEDIQKVSNIEEHHEFVIGSRYLSGSRIFGWSLSRRILSRTLNFLIPQILKIRVRDVTNGLRRYNRSSAKILAEKEPTTRGFIYLSEQAKVLKSRGITPFEIPIIFASRIAGQSSVTLKDLLVSLKGLLQISLLRRL